MSDVHKFCDDLDEDVREVRTAIVETLSKIHRMPPGSGPTELLEPLCAIAYALDGIQGTSFDLRWRKFVEQPPEPAPLSERIDRTGSRVRKPRKAVRRGR